MTANYKIFVWKEPKISQNRFLIVFLFSRNYFKLKSCFAPNQFNCPFIRSIVFSQQAANIRCKLLKIRKLRTFKYWTPQNNLNLRPSKQKKSSLNFYSLTLAQNSRYSCRSFNERPTDVYVQVTNQSFGPIAGKLSTKISSKLFQTKWKMARCVELADRAVKCPINGRRFESRTCLFE